MRVLLDTNVLIAAFATRGLCEDVLRVVLAEHELVVSDFIIDEVSRVLTKKLKLSPARVRALTQFLREASSVVNPAGPEAWPESDPDDRWVVAAAIAGDVDVLVSGDSNLVDPPDNLAIQILTPRGFWERLK